MAVVLLTAGALNGSISRWAGFNRIKQPLDLKAPLSMMSSEALAPYRVARRIVHSPEVVSALGTEEYISWVIEDPRVPEGDPLRFGQLDVTYYTGGHYLVPHTPDICRVGGGYQPAMPHENIEIEVPGIGLEDGRLPVRVCTFRKTSVFENHEPSVAYTFFCNGEFVETAQGVRLRANDPRNRHTFFSKVEISFPGGNGAPAPSREANTEAARELFGVVLPVLMSDHWPDFEAAEAAAREAGETGTDGRPTEGGGGGRPATGQ